MVYTNEWNINMNTLGLADYNVAENIKLYGFAVSVQNDRNVYLYKDENECAIEWFNYHCKNDIAITNVYVEEVAPEEYKENFLEQLRKKILELPLQVVKVKLPESEYIINETVQFSLICNGFMQGSEKDSLTLESAKRYGYGLVYWEENVQSAFFDNRFSVMFRKMQELNKKNIYPICMKVEKKGNQPILVAEGRKQIINSMEQETMQKIFVYLQNVVNSDVI